MVATADAERLRWPLWLPVAFGSGVGCYFALPFEPEVAMLIAGLSVAAIGLVCASLAPSHYLRAAFFVIAAIALGFAAAKLREEAVSAAVLPRALGPIPVEGIVEYAQIHEKSVRVLLTDVRFDEPGVTSPPRRIRVSFRSGAEDLRPGDHVSAMAVLMPPPGPTEPGAYDFARTAFFSGLGAVGYAYGWPTILGRGTATPWQRSVGAAIEALRFRVTQRIHNVLPGSTGAIASALITGDRGGIADTDEQALRDAGLAHVLAIAGLHMALVGLGLFWIVRAVLACFPLIALRYPIKKWAALAALVGAGFYLTISGAAPPAIRAFTMLGMMLLSILVDRPALSMRSVALAATLILIIEPESLVKPGFQMSFAAVAGLVSVAEWEQARRFKSVKIGPPFLAGLRRYIRGIATTSLVGSIATIPFAIYHFDRATHFAVLGNLLAMPVMGFVTMPAAALSVAAMPFGLEAAPLHVMGFGIRIMLAVGHWVSRLPGAASVAPAWPLFALVLISLGGLWCVIWRRAWRWLGLIPIAAGLVAAYSMKAPDLLVSRDGETAAVRNASGMLTFVRRPRDMYSAADWLKRDGDGRDVSRAVGSDPTTIRCDADGCIARTLAVLAFPERIDALTEDCVRADILISAVPIGVPCPHPRIVLDKAMVERAGGYAIWLAPLRIESVQSSRGDRPWSQASAPGARPQ
ncbi:MAG: ComEC/Rec2 family competence protein [Alphaproteobacteria bacterium]|nr:ComEC/Rec2 family competence protein [Alphaproteobacteria bacterium]